MKVIKVWIFLGLLVEIITLDSSCFGSSPNISKISYQSEDIFLNFTDINLRDALHAISLKTGLNIIIGPDVEGKVTASFPRPIPALIIKVVKAKVSLLTKDFPLKYALATEQASSIKSFLSPKGTLKVNEETNILIVTDIKENFKNIEDAILKIDEPARQMREKNFSLNFIEAEKAASILKSYLSETGEIEVNSLANSLLVRDVACKMKEISSFIPSLDVFKATLKIFPLKFALADEVSRLIPSYLSSKGKISVNKDKNELIVTDSSYNLKRIKDFILSIDNPQMQMKEEDFQIKYAQIKRVSSSIKERLSSYGELKEDKERSFLIVKDFSYNLEKIKKIVGEMDSFKPQRKTYRIKFAPLSQTAREIEELLSDKGKVEIDEKTDTIVVSDVEKYLKKVDELINKVDVLSSQLKGYTLEYLTAREAEYFLRNVISEYGKISLPQVKDVEEKKKNVEEDYIIIPQDESKEEVKFKSQEKNNSPKNRLYENKNTIYITDLKRNIPKINKEISKLNSSSMGEEITTKTFYIKEGSLDNIAITIANMIGVKPENIKGMELTEKKGQWMNMSVPSPNINLGTIGPGK